jgi:acyl-CoA thioesterase-1
MSRKNLLDMISRSRKAGAHIVLVTVHEPDLVRLLKRHAVTDYGKRPPAERLAALDDVVTALAGEDGISLADFRSTLRANGGPNMRLSTDGVHLTRAGYGLLAATVRAKLPQHVSNSETIVCFGDSLTYGIGVRAPGDSPETSDTYPAQLRALLAH